MAAYEKLRRKPSVKAKQTLVEVNLASTVGRVAVQQFTDDLCSLVLHAGLDHVDGVDGSSTQTTSDTTQDEVVGRLADIVQEGGLQRLFDFSGFPLGVEELVEVGEAQLVLGVIVGGGHLEDDICFHRRKGSVFREVCSRKRLAKDELS